MDHDVKVSSSLPGIAMSSILLILVLAMPQGVTSLTQSYENEAACAAASAKIRERLVTGRIVLLVCTPQA